MSEKVWCEVFPSEFGWSPVFFMNNRVDVSLWFERGFPEVKEVFENKNWVRADGTWALVKSSRPVWYTSGAYGIFVLFEDADQFVDLVTELLKKRPHWRESTSEGFKDLLEKSKKAIESYTISHISEVMENAIETVKNAPREISRVKRRRADLSGIISAIEHTIQQKAQEEQKEQHDASTHRLIPRKASVIELQEEIAEVYVDCE